MGFFDGADETLAQQAEQDAQSDNKYEPDPGDVLHGVLLKAEAYTKDTHGYEPTLVITVRNVGETKVGGIAPGESGYLFTPTVLRRKVLEAEPAIGTAFILEFKGKVTPDKGGNPYKDYTLVTESTKGEGDESKRDRALWGQIQMAIAQASQNRQPQQGYGGGGQQASQSNDWKF